MTRWLLFVFAAGCASAPVVETDWLSECSLQAETACTMYGASIAGAPEAPAGQLAIGLADKAAGLPAEEAVDYWYRVEEIVAAGSKTHDLVNRRAAPSFAALAALDRDELIGIDLDSVDNAELDSAREIHQRLLRRAEFAVKWGSASAQATAARALADGYSAQGRLMGAIVIPSELTPVARVEFEEKRDGLAAELLAEGERLRAGLAQHCQKHQLSGPDCRSTTPSAP